MTKPSPRTQEDRKAETRSLLLAAAADLFAHKGYHGTTAEAIANAANRTTGALYDHFGGKSGMLVAIVESWVEQTIIDITSQIAVTGSDIPSRLGSVWNSIVNQGDNGDQWLLLEIELWLNAVRDDELHDAGAARFRVMREALAQGLEEWSEEFGFTLPAPSADLAAQVIALFIGAAFQYQLDNESITGDRVVQTLGRILGLPQPQQTTAASVESDTVHDGINGQSKGVTPSAQNASTSPAQNGSTEPISPDANAATLNGKNSTNNPTKVLTQPRSNR